MLHREFKEAIRVRLDLKRGKAYVSGKLPFSPFLSFSEKGFASLLQITKGRCVMGLDGQREHTVFDHAGFSITGIDFVDNSA